MSAESAAIVRTFPVGKRGTCTLTVPQLRQGGAASLVAEWEPSIPRRLKPRELEDYRRGRDSLIAELIAMSGSSVMVVEV